MFINVLCRGSLLLVLLLVLSPGCNIGGQVADTLFGAGNQASVSADYTGLAGKTTAIIVAADEWQLGRTYAGADMELSRELHRALKQVSPTTQLVDPNQVDKYLADNPYWTSTPYDRIMERLNVERLVVVDLLHYSLHEPGNPAQLIGRIVANVGVAEAEAPGGDLAYSQRLTTTFPEGVREFGTIELDIPTVKLGLHKTFARQFINLFVDHKVKAEW